MKISNKNALLFILISCSSMAGIWSWASFSSIDYHNNRIKNFKKTLGVITHLGYKTGIARHNRYHRKDLNGFVLLTCKYVVNDKKYGNFYAYPVTEKVNDSYAQEHIRENFKLHNQITIYYNNDDPNDYYADIDMASLKSWGYNCLIICLIGYFISYMVFKKMKKRV